MNECMETTGRVEIATIDQATLHENKKNKKKVYTTYINYSLPHLVGVSKMSLNLKKTPSVLRSPALPKQANSFSESSAQILKRFITFGIIGSIVSLSNVDCFNSKWCRVIESLRSVCHVHIDETKHFVPASILAFEVVYIDHWSRRQGFSKLISMGIRRGRNGYMPPLEIGTKNQKFLQNLKSAA